MQLSMTMAAPILLVIDADYAVREPCLTTVTEGETSNKTLAPLPLLRPTNKHKRARNKKWETVTLVHNGERITQGGNINK
jgi:hypothetical protein